MESARRRRERFRRQAIALGNSLIGPTVQNQARDVANYVGRLAGDALGDVAETVFTNTPPIVWDWAQQNAQDLAHYGGLVGTAVAGALITADEAGPSSSNIRGKRKRPDARALVPRSILESPASSSVTPPTKRFRGSTDSLSLPTRLDPWYKGYRPTQLDINSTRRSPEWLRWTPSFSTPSSQRLLARGNRHRKHLSWFNTRVLLRGRRNIKLRKAKGLKRLRAAKLLFARRPIPHSFGRNRGLHYRRQLAAAKKLNFRRHLAAKKSLAYAARQYRRLVRSRQRSRRRR